ncbi:MAG: tetraacyldisaccharide 4'-kinase [Terriglobales bacterium]|jgi:tetraacyldisaccharide 4'-kinase
MNPLAAIYRGVTAARNSLFDRGVLRSRRLNRPVVSVGNLSAGGAGKTPFVIALGELLQARGVPFDVLSRGYGRKTRGALIVDPDGSPADFGDEPLLIARRLRVPVIVGESRYEAGKLAEEKFETQLHILDDGFQHRSVARDFDIVLMTAHDFEDRLIPAGRLREPLSALARADAVALPAEFSSNHAALSGKLVWRMRRDIVIPAAPQSPVVFCGIARPAQFFAQVRAAGISPAAEIVFRDHHVYGPNDIQSLIDARRNRSADGFVTTQKDAINLAPNAHLLQPLIVAELRLTLDNPAGVLDAILDRINKRKLRS